MPTIQALEAGKLRLSEKLAARISQATGTSESELLKGLSGKLKTIDGKPFSRSTFDAWQAHRLSRNPAPADQASLLRWTQLLLQAAENKKAPNSSRLMIEALELVRSKLDLSDSVNDLLMAFQHVETHTADVREWKKEDRPRILSLGYHPSLPLPPACRLTLSLQTTPSWSPATAPPIPAPTNVDLIPAGYFIIGLGTAGCRMAEVWWGSLCREHGIDSQTGHALHHSPTGSWQAFFRKVMQIDGSEKYVPRAIFADFSETDLALLVERSGELFHPSALLFGKSSSANVFLGAKDPVANSMVETMLNLLQRHSHDTGGISGIFLCHSLEGGTGGGLACQALHAFEKSLPAVPVVCVCPLPDPDLGHSVTAPYNIALTMAAIQKKAKLTLLFDHRAMEVAAAKHWKWPIQNVEKSPNFLISEAMSAFSAPLRFPGSDSPPIRLPEWLHSILGPDEGVTRYLMPVLSPLQQILGSKKGKLTSADLLKSCVPLLKSLGGKPRHVTLLLKARGLEDIWGSTLLQTAKTPKYYRVSSERGTGRQESVTLLKDAGNFGQRLEGFAKQAQQLLKRQAYLHWYLNLGYTESDISKSVDELLRTACEISQL